MATDAVRALARLTGEEPADYSTAECGPSWNLLRDIAVVQHADMQVLFHMAMNPERNDDVPNRIEMLSELKNIMTALNDLNENIITATGEITAALERIR